MGTHRGLDICATSSYASSRLLEVDELALLVEECTLLLLDVNLSSLIDATFVLLNIEHRASLCQRISAEVLRISSRKPCRNKMSRASIGSRLFSVEQAPLRSMIVNLNELSNALCGIRKTFLTLHDPFELFLLRLDALAYLLLRIVVIIKLVSFRLDASHAIFCLFRSDVLLRHGSRNGHG